MNETLKNNEKAKVQEMIDFYTKEIDGKNDTISYTKAQLKELKQDLADCKERLAFWKNLKADLDGKSAKNPDPVDPQPDLLPPSGEGPKVPEAPKEDMPEKTEDPVDPVEQEKIVDSLFPENNEPETEEEAKEDPETETETTEEPSAESDMNEIWPDQAEESVSEEENDGFPSITEAWTDNN